MLSLLERNIASIHRRLVLVAPKDKAVPDTFSMVHHDDERHGKLIREMQRLRGQVYLADGAVKPDQLSPEGLHQTPEDHRSWHLLMLNRDHQVNACVWYMEHDRPSSIEELRVRHSALARLDSWRAPLTNAVESELRQANDHGLRFAEVGGWAVSSSSRCTSEGLLLALGAYSLGRLFGGSLGLTTATVRHCSSTILRRLGGRPLETNGVALPAYFDPRYGCDMEVLRFDSRRLNPKYAGLIEMLKERLSSVAVVAVTARDSAGTLSRPSFAA